MPNPWTGKGNPYTREEVRARLQATLDKGNAIIAAGAGTGISAKFIEKGGADLIIIYNSGRFRMMGHGSTAGMMAYGDANAIAMEIGEYEVLPVVEEVPVICGVHATDRFHMQVLASVCGMGIRQLAQQQAGGHGRDARQWRQGGGCRGVHGRHSVPALLFW